MRVTWCGRRIALVVGSVVSLAVGRTIFAQQTQVRITQSNAQPQNGQTNQPKAKGWLGVEFMTPTGGYPVIISVVPQGPAQAAGVLAGDTLLSFNNYDARTEMDQLQKILSHPGDKVVLKLKRNDVRTIPVVIARRPLIFGGNGQGGFSFEISSNSDSVGSVEVQGVPALFGIQFNLACGSVGVGATVAHINADLAEALHIPNTGVLVLDVTPGTPAKTAGLKSGDVIVTVDSTAVSSSSELIAVAAIAADRNVVLHVLRNGKAQNLTLRW